VSRSKGPAEMGGVLENVDKREPAVDDPGYVRGCAETVMSVWQKETQESVSFQILRDGAE